MKLHEQRATREGQRDQPLVLPDDAYEETMTRVVNIVAVDAHGWLRLSLDCGHALLRTIAPQPLPAPGDVMPCSICLRQLIDRARKDQLQ